MAYELGALDDRERRELELHVLQCEHCFEELRSFGPAAKMMRSDRVLHERFAAMVNDPTITEQEVAPSLPATARREHVWRSWLPLSLTAAIVLFALILRPWKLEIGPSDEAVALENRLTIIPFENLAESEDSQRLGDVAANLLITAMGESGYLRVVSTPQLYLALHRLGIESDQSIDARTAAKVARHEHSRWLLTGSILKEDEQRAIAIQLSDVSTGDVLASLRVEGGPQDDIFSLIDQLTEKLKGHLPQPPEVPSITALNVASVTTSSPEAFRNFLDGIQYVAKVYLPEAKRSFERAVELDSTFAMAHYYLATLGSTKEIDKAVAYIGNAGNRDKYLIRSRAAWIAGDADSAIRELTEAERVYPDDPSIPYNLGIYEYSRGRVVEAIDSWKKTLAVDPEYKESYNQLAYAYQRLGDWEQSFLAIDKYIALAPKEANPYDTKGDLYAANGMIKKAADCYRTALSLKPDLEASKEKLGYMLVYSEEYEAADSCFHDLANSDNPDTRSLARFSLAHSPLAQGQFKRCLNVLDDAIAADSAAYGEERCPSSRLLKALVLYEMGQLDRAVSEVEKGGVVYSRVIPGGRLGYRHFQAQLLADAGEIRRAREIAGQLLTEAASTGCLDSSQYWYAVGCIHLAEGSPMAAIEALKQVNADVSVPSIAVGFQLARAMLEAGRYGEAVQELQSLLSDHSSTRLFFGGWNVMIHYYLGRAYERSGWSEKAIEQYDRFLHLWRNADEGIQALNDARGRVARLRT